MLVAVIPLSSRGWAVQLSLGAMLCCEAYSHRNAQVARQALPGDVEWPGNELQRTAAC